MRAPAAVLPRASAIACAAALLLGALAPGPPTPALMAPPPMAPALMTPTQAAGVHRAISASSLFPALGADVPARTAVPSALPADAQAILAAEHGTWRWPMSSTPIVVHDFRPPAKRWLRGHRGVDLTVGLSGEIRAPEGGRVSHVGTVVDRKTITLDHGRGLRSSFEPVASELRKGDRVRKGEVIGVLSARDHCRVTLRACVHWGVRLGDEYVHPLPFVGAQRPSVLLPVPD